MEEILYQLIKDISERKSMEGIAPTHVMKIDIDRLVANSLNNLHKQGRIKVGRTINDKWISIV
jgi:hypothetical protein